MAHRTVYYALGGTILAALEEGRDAEYESALRESGNAFRSLEHDGPESSEVLCGACCVRSGRVEPITVAGPGLATAAFTGAVDLDARIEAAVQRALSAAGLGKAPRRQAARRQKKGAVA